MILEFLTKKHECSHKHINPDVEEAYCPDCGALIKNKWYLVRCSCCNIKRPAHIHYDKIEPNTKFCPNCGGTDFYIEELENINFIDINYAIYKKEVIQKQTAATSQVWIEKENYLADAKKLIECKV